MLHVSLRIKADLQGLGCSVERCVIEFMLLNAAQQQKWTFKLSLLLCVEKNANILCSLE